MAKKGKKKKPDLRGYATTSAPSKKDIIVQSTNEDKVAIVSAETIALDQSLCKENDEIKTGSVNEKGVDEKEEKESNENEEMEKRLGEHSLVVLNASKAMDFDSKKAILFKSNLAVGRIILSKSQEANLFEFISADRSGAPQAEKKSWTSSELKGAYIRLQKLGLDQDFLENVLENCPFASFDEVVNWMCINCNISLLPADFTDKFEHDTVPADLNLVSQTVNEKNQKEELPNVPSNEELLAPSHEQLIHPPSDDQDFNKRWILERSAAANDSDDNSSIYSDTPKQPSRGDLEAELEELSEQAALAKARGDKESQRKYGKEIGRLKQLLGSVSINIQEKSSLLVQKTPQIPLDEIESDEGMFFTEEAIMQTDLCANSSVRIVRDMGPSKVNAKSKWSGMTSCQLLQELVSKRFTGSSLKYSVELVFANAFRASLSISHTVFKFIMDEGELVTKKEDAKQYIATKALYVLLDRDISIASRLSPSFSDLYKEWVQKEKDALNSELAVQVGEMDTFVERLMRERENVASQSLSQPSKVSPPSEVVAACTSTHNSGGRRRIPSLSEWKKKIQNPLLEKRKSLPVFHYHQQVVDLVNGNQVVVISSETGSGKSTQVPTFLLQSAIESDASHFDLVCTQPRRISAVSLASRVAQEVGYPSSSLIAYQVKNDSTVTENTRITYCTTGLLLRRMVSDPTLSSTTHIIIDECHERTLDSDFLLLLIKNLLRTRSDLRVVLMSATANANLFASYFNNVLGADAPTLSIPGRSFPVSASFLLDIIAETRYRPASDSVYVLKKKGRMVDAGSVKVSGRGGNQYRVQLKWQEQVEEDSDFDDFDEEEYETLEDEDDVNDGTLQSERSLQLLEKAAKIMNRLDPKKINFELISHIIGYILEKNPADCQDGSCIVFLPGVGEINRLAEVLENDFGTRSSNNGKSSSPILVLPLHGGLTNGEQSLVFSPAPRGKLKVVLSTNVAETGVTIPDAVYVIDTLRAREIRHDPKRGISRLADTLVSKANALQRRGRAGRVRPGFAFHLIPLESFEKLPDQQSAEMQRLPLEEICLKMRITMPGCKELSIQDLFQQMLDPPPTNSVVQACKVLHLTEALDEKEMLTRLGELLGQLPVDLKVGKLLLSGLWLGCLDSSLTIASLLTAGKSPFLYPSHSIQQAKTAHAVFYRDNSDILAWVAAYNEWQKMWLDGKSQSALKTFCQLRYLNFEVLLSVYESRMQLLQSLFSIGLIGGESAAFEKVPKWSLYKEKLVLPDWLNEYSKDSAMNCVAYSIGLYPSVVFKSPSSITSPFGSLHLSISQNQNFTTKLHSNSSLNIKTMPSSFYTYNAIQIKSVGGQFNKSVCFLYDLNISMGLIYPLLAARSVEYKPMQGVLILDDGLVIRCVARSAAVIVEYRKLLRASFARFLNDPLHEEVRKETEKRRREIHATLLATL